MSYTARILFIFLIALSVFPAQSFAQSSRVYFSGYFGLTVHRDMDFQSDSPAFGGDLEMDNAPTFAGALGVRLSPQFRVEAEVSLREGDFANIDIPGTGRFDAGGEIESYITLINLYYDFDVPWSLKPYIGGGLGFGWHEGNLVDGSSFNANASDDTTNLMWQAEGGLRYRVNPSLALSGGYRYLDGTDLEFSNYEIDYHAHEFRMGVEYDLPIK